jgi:hypothetical protein
VSIIIDQTYRSPNHGSGPKKPGNERRDAARRQ